MLHSTGRAWLLAAAALTLANPLLHKTVSDVCDLVRARWGFSLYDRAALIAIPLVSVLAVSPFLARRGHLLLLRRPLAPVSLLILGAITLAAQRWLLVANIELIHLPQFALLAALLLGAGLRAPAAFLVATCAGMLDETYQHLVVYAGVSGTYFDINDIVLNAIGAAWGVVLFADIFRRGDTGSPAKAVAHASGAPRRWLTSPRGAMVALIVVLPVALWLDPPHFSPLLRPTDSGRALFRVLSVAEGLVVCTFLWGLVASLVRDDEISTC